VTRRNGGLPGRRAVVRWAWRMLRLEWRRQVLVALLLTFTVAGSLLGIAAVYTMSSPPQAKFGDANVLVHYSAPDPATLDAGVAAARTWFGTVDVIGHRTVHVAGLARPLQVRDQDPAGPYGKPMLRLLAGRYPTADGEVAVTGNVAAILGLSVGDPVPSVTATWTVVGTVENPADLRAQFLLAAPGQGGPRTSVTILTVADPQRLDEFDLSAVADNASVSVEQRTDERTMQAVATLGLVALALLLICFVAVAGFVAMAQRRTRQFGLLAAIGATPRHVRLALLAAGAGTGAVAAATGAALAIPLWIAAVPRLEVASGHRINPLGVPWLLLGAAVLLALLAATGAAWWPAQAASRTPIVRALSMRPHQPRPAHRAAAAGVLLLGGGVVCLRLSHQHSVPFIIAGTIAMILGLPLLSPLAVRALAAAGVRLPVAGRLALRDLARHQARSGAALAAISLALAVPALIVITDAASQAAEERVGTAVALTNRQLILWAGSAQASIIPDRPPAEIAATDTSIRRYATTLDAATVVPLDVPMSADARRQVPAEGGSAGLVPVLLGEVIHGPAGQVTGIHTLDDFAASQIYLATPDVLRYYGITAAVFGAGTDVITSSPGDNRVFVAGGMDKLVSDPAVPAVTAPLPGSRPTSLPRSLLNPATAQHRGWATVRAGWVVENNQSLTTEQLAAARDLALATGLTVESADLGSPRALIRATWTAAGAILALGILAMTVGLIRGEAARDLRTLTAAGATGRVRRALAATTASALALLGAVLGIGVAYLALAAAYDKDIGLLRRVPIVDLTMTFVGVPLIAAAAAWLLAGREPATLARTRLE
jgi:putative ABC transport system permease protein